LDSFQWLFNEQKEESKEKLGRGGCMRRSGHLPDFANGKLIYKAVSILKDRVLGLE
jgi:hypothetical protein